MEGVDLTTADLLTVAGASVVAIVITQFAKIMFSLSAAVTRSVSLIVGLVVVVLVGASSGAASDIGAVILLVFVGAQAGLAASAAFDVVRSGIDHAVVDRSS